MSKITIKSDAQIKRARPLAVGLLLSTAFLGVITASARAQSFDWLGSLAPSGSALSDARGVSGDGAVVVGVSERGRDVPYRAFRWTREGGMQSLGGLSEDGSSWAQAANYDGSIVVGTSGILGESHAFRWSVEGMEDLGVLPGMVHSGAHAVNEDGSVVVGSSGTAFRWTRADGMQDLGTLPGGTYATAEGISGDGAIIVGGSGSAQGQRAFLWTSAGGMEDLGVLPGAISSYAYAVSADGSVVVGEVVLDGPDYGTQAFRWTRQDGMQELGSLPGGGNSWALSVSGNGNVIVGIDVAHSRPNAVAWLRGGAVIELGTYFSGSDLGASQGYGVSADGGTLCGAGKHSSMPFAETEAWVGTFAVLPGCAADFNVDLKVNSQDFFDFLTAFFSGMPSADIDGSGTINSADFFAFLDSFLTGCI